MLLHLHSLSTPQIAVAWHADVPELVAGSNTTSLEFSASEEGSAFFCGCAGLRCMGCGIWAAVLSLALC